jgi:hypothetical protein
MKTEEHIKFGAQQVYSDSMMQFLNPIHVMAGVLSQMDINPYSIKNLNVIFRHSDEGWESNYVRVTIEMKYPMPKSWFDYMEQKLMRVLKDGFVVGSYGRKKTEDDDYFKDINKEPFYFSKEN